MFLPLSDSSQNDLVSDHVTTLVKIPQHWPFSFYMEQKFTVRSIMSCMISIPLIHHPLPLTIQLHLPFFPLFTLPQPYWPPCCSLNLISMILPQGLCPLFPLNRLLSIFTSFGSLFKCHLTALYETALPVSSLSTPYSFYSGLFFLHGNYHYLTSDILMSYIAFISLFQ